MTRLARAFLAVAPPDPVLDAIEECLRPLRAIEPPLRWLPPNLWHLTVQFLGVVDDDDTLTTAVGEAVTRVAPFTVRLAGAGAFPAPRRATVAWIGVEDATALTALAKVVDTATATLGYEPERRPYHPHLTVGRFAQPQSLIERLDTFGAPPVGPPWTVGEIALIQSDTRPEGAVHTVRARLPFSA
jgi:RNA 2',3'-cyclic 3'-phosphodiesterase